MQNNIGLSPKLKLLWKQSYLEEGYKETDIPPFSNQPLITLYPRSYVEDIEKIGYEKTYNYNFRGALYIDKETIKNRFWIIDFAKKYFNQESLFQITDQKAQSRKWFFFKRHKLLGEFDYTFIKKGFVPKENPIYKRAFFDSEYFFIMCKSRFTLCPAGDAPWSMRFYEAILSKSIPILESKQHSGRNKLEYELGYKFYTTDDKQFTYHPEWAEENYQIFLSHQTLIDTQKIR